MAKPLKLDNIGKQNMHYVVAVDDSNCALHALRWADFMAKKNDKLSIIHAFETEHQSKVVLDRYPKYPKKDPKRYSLEILNNKQFDPDQRIKHYVNTTQKQSVDLLVTGLYGKTYEFQIKNGKKATVGSTSDLSLRSARCSSLFVHHNIPVPNDQNELKICCGVDGSANSRHSFQTAISLLNKNNTLYVVHIETEYSNIDNSLPQQYQSQNVIKDYKKLAQDMQKNLGFKVDIQVKLIEGAINISDALIGFAKDNGCHILCVGADGMTAYCNKQPILGSVSDECVKTSKCNIIVSQINEFNSTPRESYISV